MKVVDTIARMSTLVKMFKKEEFYMREALKEAEKAFGEDEVPVGAVIVHENKIIGRGHNQVEK